MNELLVSVAVITYNSSEYVLDTLDSIKYQTYHNIELVISDDCSTDNTVALCECWLSKNKNRFVRTQIVETPQNTGVSANCNRAEDACQGEWVKLIAGDDMLLPNSISDYVEFVKTTPSAIFVFGKVKAFGASELTNRKASESGFDYELLELQSAKEQLDRLIRRGQCITAPTFFYNRKKSIDLGIKADERIPFIEDRPRWLQILRKNERLYFLNKETVKYRISQKESLSTGRMYSDKFFMSQRLIEFYYYLPYRSESKDVLINEIVKYEADLYMKYKSVVNSHAYCLGIFLLQPVYLAKRWLKRLCGK